MSVFVATISFVIYLICLVARRRRQLAGLAFGHFALAIPHAAAQLTGRR